MTGRTAKREIRGGPVDFSRESRRMLSICEIRHTGHVGVISGPLVVTHFAAKLIPIRIHALVF